MAELDPIKVLKWRVGRPADIWLSHRDLIANFIKKHNIKPLEVDAYPAIANHPQAEPVETAAIKTKSRSATAALKLFWPKPYPGGLRIPHLHFGADIYLLDREQWKDFSGTVLREVRERIGKAREISFEQTLELTEAVNTLG